MIKNARAGVGVARLPRRLGLASCLLLVIGVVTGSGIFRVPSPVAAEAGNLTSVAIVWVLAGVLTILAALSVAELAAMFPLTGGPYVYLREGYGRPVGFLYGWMELLTGPIGSAAKALIFSGYLAAMVPMSMVVQHAVAAGLLFLVGLLNVRSIRLAAAAQNLSTGAKLAALVALAVAIYLFAPVGAGNPLATQAAGQPRWMGIGTALVTVMFAYEGWQGVTMVAGEVKNPQRNLPIALVGGLLAVMVFYMLINAAYFRVLSVPEIVASKSVAADAAATVLGRFGASVIGALVLLSVFGTLNGGVMAGPRVLAAMADDGLFFSSVRRVHAKYATPYVAITLSVTLAIVYVSFRDFSDLVQAYILAKWPFNALMVAAVFVLRRRLPDLARSYHVVGYPLVPAIYVLATILVMALITVAKPWSALTSIGITLLGLPVYYVWVSASARRGK